MDVNVTSLQERAKVEAKSYLEQLLSEGARKLLQAAIENEVAVYLQSQSGRRSESGERSVGRNGHLPERDLVTGVGPVKIRQPRVRHRDGGSFSSEILPKYMRRVPSVDALIPALYLKGISTGDFSEALSAILAEKAAGLSATNIVRLKAIYQAEATVALCSAPSDPLVAMLEVLGWSAEDQQGQPLTLGIGGHAVEALAHRFEASQIVMLIEQLFETLQFGALHKPHLDLV